MRVPGLAVMWFWSRRGQINDASREVCPCNICVAARGGVAWLIRRILEA